MDNFQELYEQLVVENDTNVHKIGIFPGAFKPPHTGHFHTAMSACRECDEVYIFVSKPPRALSTRNIAEPAGSKDCDSSRYSNFMKNDKYTSNLLSIGPAECARMTSASAMRAAIAIKDKHTIFENLPEGVDKEAIYATLMMSNDVSSADYGHITVQQAMSVWDQYGSILGGKYIAPEMLHIVQSAISPVKDTYDLVNDINNSENAGGIAIKLYVGT